MSGDIRLHFVGVAAFLSLAYVASLASSHDAEQQRDLDRLEQRIAQLETPRAVPSRADRTRHQTPALRPGIPAGHGNTEGFWASNGLAQRGLNLDVTCYVWTGNRTASGVWPRVGMAASNRYPFGTRLRVEGVGVVTVTDRIGHSSELDLFFADRGACLRFGRRSLNVAVVR